MFKRKSMEQVFTKMMLIKIGSKITIDLRNSEKL